MFWQALKAHGLTDMRIGHFRRRVQRWLIKVQSSALQDAKSASRGPTEKDPEGTIDDRILDAVEETLEESVTEEESSEEDRTEARMAEAIENTDVHEIVHQEELNEQKRAAVYGMGHRILRMTGRIKGPPPLAHIKTGRRQKHWQRNQSQAKSADETATHAVKSLIAAEAEATKTVRGR